MGVNQECWSTGAFGVLGPKNEKKPICILRSLLPVIYPRNQFESSFWDQGDLLLSLVGMEFHG